MKEECKDDYIELFKINNWRKKLLNFWLEPFELHNYMRVSVEHYYQASKFKKQNPEFYFQFSLNSNSILSKNPNMAKSAVGKTGKIKGKQFRNKNIKVDDDFFNTSRANEEMFNV